MTDKQKRVIIWCRVSSEEQGAANKESIPTQLERQRQLASKNNWVIVDELVTDFSMDYFTYDEFCIAAAEAGWEDPQRMWLHWASRDFDVITCRYLDRIGREQSILSEFIGRTMLAGATIIPLDEAAVDNVNYRMTSAIAGLGAAAHIDKLKAGRDMGMKGRAAQGLKLTRNIPMFYAADENGKLYPDRERYQRLFDDAGELYLEGTSYEQIPYELEKRGHLSPITGKRFNKTVFSRLMLSARTWGHAEFNRTGRKRGSYMKHAEIWVTGRADPPPDVYFKPDVCEPIWIGQQREDMIDEFQRRYEGIRGGARPHDTYALSRICICEICGRYMSVQKRGKLRNHMYLFCHNGRLRKKGCTNYQGVRFEYAESYINGIRAEVTRDPDYLMTDNDARSRIPSIDRDIERLTTRYNNLIDLIADAPPSGRPEYQAKIDALLIQRDNLRAERIRAAIAEREATYTRKQREAALSTLTGQSLWDIPSTQANQLIRKILGMYRVKCNEGDVTGLRLMS